MTDFPALLRKEADALDRGQFAHPGNIRAAADVMQDLLRSKSTDLDTITELRAEIRTLKAWEEADD